MTERDASGSMPGISTGTENCVGQGSAERKRSRHRGRVTAWLGATLLAAAAQQVSAISVDPGDWDHAPPGTNLGLVYYQYSKGDELYAGGDKISSDASLRAQVGMLRLVRFVEIAGFTMTPQIILPLGSVHTGGDLGGASVRNGVGDVILASAVYLYRDDQRRVLGIMPYLTLPTGQYDRRRTLNPFGENRWKLTLQAAGVLPLSDKFTLDVVGDVQFHGDNKRFGESRQTMSQKQVWELQTHLRYHLSPATTLSASLFRAEGGETEIDRVDQDDRQRRTRMMIGASRFLAPNWQLMGHIGRDLSVDQGVRENLRVNLRLMTIF